MSNPWVRFGALIAPGAKSVVTVTAVNVNGTSVVTLRGGGSVTVQGVSVDVGGSAIIQDGRIIGAAPDLPVASVEI
jgi:hypothetical protein